MAAPFQLKTFSIEPIALPRQPQTAPTPSFFSQSPVFTKASNKDIDSPNDGEGLEPVEFDPFERSECFSILVQDPSVNAAQRQDPANLRAFKEWLTEHFPKVVLTLRSLGLVQDRPRCVRHCVVSDTKHDDNRSAQHQQNREEPELTLSDNDSDSDDEALRQADDSTSDAEAPLSTSKTAANSEAWRAIFRHATLQVLAPLDHVVVQDATRTGSVYLILNGSCDLRYQPKLLDTLLAKRKEAMNERQKGLGSKKLSLSHLSEQDVHEVLEKGVRLRTLRSGALFGLDAAMFQFATHIVSATSNGALQRSEIGLTTRTCMHVLRLPFAVFQRVRAIIAASCASHLTVSPSSTPSDPQQLHPFFPYAFSQDSVAFLRQTFLFQSLSESNLQFLASQLRALRLPRHEFLFTPGQHVAALYLVKTGQLKVASPDQVRVTISDSEREELQGSSCSGSGGGGASFETRSVELEILQPHDTIGLLDVCLMHPQYSSHCVAMSDDAEVFAVSAFVLFAVLSREPTASKHVVESLSRRHAWYKVRQNAALNHQSPHKECKLSLAVQQRGPLQCSRCGWAGHVSTSSICVRTESPKTFLTRHTSTSTNSAPRHPQERPAVPLPLPTRSSRTQQRLSSLLLAASLRESGELQPTDDLDGAGSCEPKSPKNPKNQTSPNAKAAMRARASAIAGGQFNAPLLRGLLPLLFAKSNSADATVEPERADASESELERALKRLDAALLEEAEAQQLFPSPSTHPTGDSSRAHGRTPSKSPRVSPAARPQTEQGTRRVFSLNSETKEAVGRISGAITNAKSTAAVRSASRSPPGSPRKSPHATRRNAASL